MKLLILLPIVLLFSCSKEVNHQNNEGDLSEIKISFKKSHTYPFGVSMAQSWVIVVDAPNSKIGKKLKVWWGDRDLIIFDELELTGSHTEVWSSVGLVQTVLLPTVLRHEVDYSK